MEILQVVAFCLAVTLIISMIGDGAEQRATFGMMIRMVASVFLMIFVMGKLGTVFEIIRTLGDKIGLEDLYLAIVFKVIIIAYIAEFGYQLCKDAGESAMGSKIQLAGKVMIFLVSSPILIALIDLIGKLL